ncbi:MAG: CDC48 family AAA ATPase [Thermoplasmata archaeon]
MVEKQSVVLQVAEALQQDIGLGRARIDTETRLRLGVKPGDIIEITGKKTTAAKVFKILQEDEGKGKIRIDSLIRKNAGISLNDRVVVSKANPAMARRVTIAPYNLSLRYPEGIEYIVLKALLDRPLTKGDFITVPGMALKSGALIFVVTHTDPKGLVIVTEETQMKVEEKAVGEEEARGVGVAYEDIGGLKEQLQRVKETVELPLKHPELFERMGITPPKGVLLYGPPGTGKTLIAKAVANEANASFFSIQGPEIMSKFYGGSEERLRQIFEEAKEKAPSIIFIDEIDSIAPRRDEVQGDVERRVVAQLLTLMDGLSPRGNVIVIAATNREDAVDPALRRPGRFDREIEIGVPTAEGRKEILQIHTRDMPLEGSEEEREKLLTELASITHGFVGADLAALAREAAMNALRRYLPEIDPDKPVPPEILEKMRVTREDFMNALKVVEPSALRDISVEIPNVKWEMIGGLEEVKQQVRELVELPLKNPEAYKRMGIEPLKGLLLYGPPGTGKTLIAKAVATESEANFISVKGPELISKWVGESEKAIREVFKKARQVAPCIIFFDEIDAIAPVRGLHSDSGVTERMVNQLLTSMDGIEKMQGVIVIGATNRPDILDPALLRTGRFDRLVYVPPPDEKTRLAILKIHTAKMPLRDVNLEEIAKRLEMYSGADIAGVVREAALIALRKNINAGFVTKEDFEEAIANSKPSLTAEQIKFYEEFNKRIRVPESKDKEKEIVYYR